MMTTISAVTKLVSIEYLANIALAVLSRSPAIINMYTKITIKGYIDRNDVRAQFDRSIGQSLINDRW